MATQLSQVSPTSPTRTAPPTQTDPQAEAARILAETRIGNTDTHRINFIEAALDKIEDPAQQAAVRAEVMRGLSTVEQGQLGALAPFLVRDAGGGQTVSFATNSNLTQDQWIDRARLGGYRDYSIFANLAGSNDNAAIRQAMDDVNSGRITPSQFAAAAATVDAAGQPVDLTALGLDLLQMSLDVVGIFDQSGISDGANALISAGRGDWVGAGLSVLAAVPVFGALATAGKLGKWAQTVAKAVEATASNPAARAALEPALRRIHDALGAAPDAVMRALPDNIRQTLEGIKTRLDGFFGASGRRVDEVAGTVGVVSARIGRNSAEWTLDAAGQPTRVTATLSDLRKSTARSSDELSAQGQVRGRGIQGDDAGHVIGHRFMGDQGTRNMFPQNFNFNRGAYKTMENEWAAWIQHGGTVRVNVSLTGGTAGRPDRVAVSYEVFDQSGASIFKRDTRFTNDANQVFDRVSTADIARRMPR